MKEMTPEQEHHLARIKSLFTTLVDTKYRAGQEEHGGDLFLISVDRLLDNAIFEAIDQVVYLLTLKDVLQLRGYKQNDELLKDL